MNDVIKLIATLIIAFCSCVSCYYAGYNDGKIEGYEQGRSETIESCERCNL